MASAAARIQALSGGKPLLNPVRATPVAKRIRRRRVFTVDYDEATGLISCSCGGFLTVADVRAYQAASLAAIERARAAFGHVKMVIASPDAMVQSAEVMKEVGQSMWPMTDPRDRMAVIVASSLAKIQASRTFTDDRIQAFLSESAALTWLMADRQAAAAAQASLA
jgi:hypothetical protein